MPKLKDTAKIIRPKVKPDSVKKFYFSKDDMDNFKTKQAVAEYVNGIVHQDKLLYIQVVVLPRIGLEQTTPFRIVDADGKLAFETGKDWIAIEVPGDTKNLKVNAQKSPLQNGEIKTGSLPKRVATKK